MPFPFLPRLSDPMLPLIQDRFHRVAGDPNLARALTEQAMASFGTYTGEEVLQAFQMAHLAPGDQLVEGVGARHAVTSDLDFKAFHDDWVQTEATRHYLSLILSKRPRVDHVILVPNRDIWSVVDEACLAEVLPPESTVRLYFGPLGKMDTSPHYPTFDVHQCLPLILRLLEELKPISVYVRGSAQFQAQHLGVAVKSLLPGIRLTFEVYDYTCMFDDETLSRWSQSPESREVNRNAEALLGLRADFIIDKTPGEEWDALAKALFVAPRRSYYPTLGAHWEPPASLADQPPGPFRILCAGSMPYFHNYKPGRGFPDWSYQNIIDPIVTLSKEGDLYIDIFNASHDPDLDHWPAFGGYATLFDPERVGYHARIPVREVLARIPAYDFGMFYFAASDVPIDYPLQQSLPNRCMTFIAGNLPLIVNTEMRCMAALVERFNAGITLPSTEMEDLPRRIREADLGAMKAGAVSLKRHLVACNAEALQAFKAALSEPQNRVR